MARTYAQDLADLDGTMVVRLEGQPLVTREDDGTLVLEDPDGCQSLAVALPPERVAPLVGALAVASAYRIDRGELDRSALDALRGDLLVAIDDAADAWLAAQEVDRAEFAKLRREVLGH